MHSPLPPLVVVADPEEGILQLCATVLEGAGFRVRGFRSLPEALTFVRANPADVLLIDTQMLEEDGFALLADVRGQRPTLAVVVMSGFATIDSALAAFRHGADGMLLKPFESTRTLVEGVQEGLNNRRRKEETARLAALRPLFAVAEKLMAETRSQALQEQIVQTAQDLVHAQMVGLYMWESQKGRLLAARGVAPPADAAEMRWLSQQQEPVRLSQSGHTPPEMAACLRRWGWSSLLSVPVERKGRRYLLVAARTPAPSFQEADEATLGILARLGAAALENARLHEALRESLTRLEKSQRALAQAEKMAAIGRLTASLAHEVNNPLQAVRNSLYLAARPNMSAEQQQHYIHLARREVERLSALVHRMLNFYRPGNVERHLVHFRPLVERVLTLLGEQMARAGVQAVADVPPDLPPVAGVEDQLQQVLLNLLINAMEAMPQGGTVYVLGWEEGDQVVLAVEDVGPGIPEALKSRIFEPLVSTKPQGTGLGLAVSYNIINAHHGQLQLAEPRRGTGAAFHIVLPRARQEALTAKAEEA